MSSSEWRVAADLWKIGLAGDQAAAAPGHRPEDVAGGGARGLGRHEGALVPAPLLSQVSGHSDDMKANPLQLTRAMKHMSQRSDSWGYPMTRTFWQTRNNDTREN